jgi:hypothetical protein
MDEAMFASFQSKYPLFVVSAVFKAVGRLVVPKNAAS